MGELRKCPGYQRECGKGLSEATRSELCIACRARKKYFETHSKGDGSKSKVGKAKPAPAASVGQLAGIDDFLTATIRCLKHEEKLKIARFIVSLYEE